jgi:hypothetical protein
MSLQLKSAAAHMLTCVQVIMLLPCTQRGFQAEIAFVVPGGTEAVSVSLWDHKAHADIYHRGTYPTVLRALANVIEGTPQVHLYEVSNSTFHKIVAHVAV